MFALDGEYCMQTVRLLTVSMILCMTPYAAGFAEESKVKQETKEAGKAVGTAAREVGQGTKKATKEVGQAVKEAARETGHAFKEGAKELKEALQDKDGKKEATGKSN
jgi:hypothetical protein